MVVGGWKDLEEGARRISFKCEPEQCFLLPNAQWIVNRIALSYTEGPNRSVLSSYSEDLMDSRSKK
jgi:hypothetical protein